MQGQSGDSPRIASELQGNGIACPGSASGSKGKATIRSAWARHRTIGNATELHGKEQQRNRIVLNGIERQGLCKARCRNGIVQRSLAMARRGAVMRWQRKAQPSASEVTKRAANPCVAAARRGVVAICIAKAMHPIDVRRQRKDTQVQARQRQGDVQLRGGKVKH